MGVIYFFVWPPILLLVTRGSMAFLFWTYVQPLLVMTVFLAGINSAFHAFVEFGPDGLPVPCISSLCIQGGKDDYFGEDDHMAHHNATNVFHRDLPDWQKAQEPEWMKYRASVFQNTSIVELSVLLLIGKPGWEKLAEYYVDHGSPKLSKEQIIEMLKVRARRKEMENFEYDAWLQSKAKRFQDEGPLKAEGRWNFHNGIIKAP